MQFEKSEFDLYDNNEWRVNTELFDEIMKDKDHKYTTEELDDIMEYRLTNDFGFWEEYPGGFSFIGAILTLMAGAAGIFIFPIVWLILCAIVLSAIEYDPNGSIFNIFANGGSLMGYLVLLFMAVLSAFGAYGILCMLSGKELNKYQDRFEREVNFNVQAEADYEKQLEDERTHCEEKINEMEAVCEEKIQKVVEACEEQLVTMETDYNKKSKEFKNSFIDKLEKSNKSVKEAMAKAAEYVKKKDAELVSYKKQAENNEKELAQKDRELRKQEVTLATQEATIAKLTIKLSRLETKLLKQGHEDLVLSEYEEDTADI